MKHIVLNILLLFALITNAQDYKRTQNWYFGDSAGLSFATDPPTALTDGAMNTIEGCATISDTLGNLLFYTNGVKVWNKNHQIMDNGTGLKGHISSTQSSLIVPWPDNDSLFYIFTTDAVGQFNGLQYSLVNIKENEGLGKVIVKNILLHTPVCEKLTATYHQNGKDIWVITHGWGDNNFYAYQITKDTILTCPVLSKAGSLHSGSVVNAQGAIKFSSDGKQLASCVFNLSQSSVELFDFNNQNGSIEFSKKILNVVDPYSIEFSKQNRFLYVATNKSILLQYNLQSSDIDKSKFELLNTGSTSRVAATLQIGIDDKIYLSFPDSLFLGIIERPDSSQEKSTFIVKGASLSPSKSQYGLPNFITSYFYTPKLDFNYTTNCETDSINFVAKRGTSHAWQIFRNKAILHSSTQSTTYFNFTDTGEYVVQLISNTDTVTKTIYIEPKLTLGQDTILCNQNSYSLLLPSNYRCITWQDGADSTRYTLTQSGTYNVSAYNIRGCLVSDTVKVTFTTLAAPVIIKSNDSLFTDSGYNIYKWYYNNASIVGNTHIVKITKNGSYRVEITDSNGCTNTSANFLVSGLGVYLLNTQDYFNIYPIPTENQLFIEPLANIGIKEIHLIDMLGRKHLQPPKHALYLNHLAKGIYYLEITDTENNHYTSKIIIN